MFDKRKSSDDGSTAPPPGSDRKEAGEGCAKMDSSTSGGVQIPEHSGSGLPPGHYRQGYCSCCQVHYINLEKHLASDQHKQISGCKRIPLNPSVMMERFLHDVHLYHPQNYQDTRPTYDDIPDISISPRLPEVCSDAPLLVQNHKLVPTKSHPEHTQSISDSSNCYPSTSKYNSRNIAVWHPYNEKLKIEHCSTDEQLRKQNVTSDCILTVVQKALTTGVDTVPQSLLCTNNYPCCSKNANNIPCSQTVHSALNQGTKKKNILETSVCEIIDKCPHFDVTTKTMRCLHAKPLASQGSCLNLTSGIQCGKLSGMESQGNLDHILRDHVVDRHLKHTKCSKESETNNPTHSKGLYLSQGERSTVDEIIEEVIWKYCYRNSESSVGKEEDTISSLNINSVLGCTEDSSLSFDWDVQIKSEEDLSKTDLKNVDVLKDKIVNIDEEYKSKLKSVLGPYPVKEPEGIKAEIDEEVLPALPHVPPSFVGKTWSQIKYEDDLKIEALVQQFRKGKFHCYFESGSSSRKCKRKFESEENEMKILLETNNWKLPKDDTTPPTLNDFSYADNDSDIPSVKSEKVVKTEIKMPCRRIWRLASRCQIVKVSHGTQTSLVNYPVVRKKVNKNELGQHSDHVIFNDLEGEMTPDMQTRMCALKLPESYTKIFTPLQPKTMVYVLSHPDIKCFTGKPAYILRSGRNQYSTDSRDSANYKYKQSPLKYYDPLTNRILKTPPRNCVRGHSIKGPYVRKLFKSLSSESNVDKFDYGLKETTSSKKSFSSCSVASLCFETAKVKDLNSSLTGSGSSIDTEYFDCLKSEHPDKPYAQFAPCKASHTKVKRDIPFVPSITRTIRKTLGPNKNEIKQKIVHSTANIKQVAETRCHTKSKHKQCGMIKNVGKIAQKKLPKIRKQPLRKASLRFLKYDVPSVQAVRPRQKNVTGQKKELPRRHFNSNTGVKSKCISRKPCKRESDICKPVLKNAGQSKAVKKPYEEGKDKKCSRTRNKTLRIVQETLPHIVNKPRLRTQPSRTRGESESTTRRRGRK
ncbi:DBF4-type zinc finger-containing 2 isoform X1 [Pelobates cultripes]|uniref:DBF4-type zinc finger-containing 2 isoform X1 n=2 Tax=Pelobates cultripes TaxID=61616 RepID=A0AAD1WHM4_PELCU|nr:DBF4-type zinc finger-containing 2 isoform X1 [Pelobates cultripes]